MNGQKHNIGEKFGTNTIIAVERDEKGKLFYVVKCNCGVIKKYIGSRLRMCLKCRYCHALSFIGKKNHKTTFIKYIKDSVYECICDCGKQFIGEIRSRSCGCHIEEDLISDAKKLEGVVFEGIRILRFLRFEFLTSKQSRTACYEAKCICGKKFVIQRGRFFHTKTCGCRLVNSYSRGENHYNNKHSESDIRAIKDLFLSGQYSKKQLSEIFNLSIDMIRSVIAGRSWSFIKNDKKLLKDSPVKDEFCRKIIPIEIGKKYGSWEVLSKATSRKGHSYYFCKCECQNTYETMGSSLRNGKTTRCYRCNITTYNCNKKYDYANCVGKKFGTRTILSCFWEKQKYRGIVKCDCGNQKTIGLLPLFMGKVKNCEKCYPRSSRKGIKMKKNIKTNEIENA